MASSEAPRGARLTRRGTIKVGAFTKSNALIAIVVVVLAAVTVYAFVQMDYGKTPLATAFANAVSDFVEMATTPHVNGHFKYPDLAIELLVTLALATLTTLGGAVIALVLGLFAASNLSNRAVSNAIKIVMSIARAVPTILWVLVFTVASFEEVDEGVLEALRATGASWWQIVCRGVLSEKLNEMLSWTFIRFEINFVAAVVVAGMAGSGGIGYSLFLAGNYYFDIHEIGLIVYMCMAVSIVLEVSATKLRKRYVVNR